MKRTIFVGLVLSLLPLSAVLAQAVNHKAHSVFLYNFARYAEWPASAPHNDVVRFGILGKSGVFEELDEVLKVKTINGKKCVVERITDPATAEFYHIVFVADSDSGKLTDLLAAIGSKPTMVVTERDNLVRKGASISFIVSDDNKLQFQLNDQVLNSRNIQLSASLKGMALISK